MIRRDFVKLVIGGIAAITVPFRFPTPATVNDKLDQVAWALGKFLREHNLDVESILGLDESGCMVLSANIGEQYPSFHIADRELKYKQFSYQHEISDQDDKIFIFLWASGREQPFSFQVNFV